MVPARRAAGLSVPVGYGGEVRLGAVRVPDERIDALSRIFSPKKTTYAEMMFCDRDRTGRPTRNMCQVDVVTGAVVLWMDAIRRAEPLSRRYNF